MASAVVGKEDLRGVLLLDAVSSDKFTIEEVSLER